MRWLSRSSNVGPVYPAVTSADIITNKYWWVLQTLLISSVVAKWVSLLLFIQEVQVQVLAWRFAFLRCLVSPRKYWDSTKLGHFLQYQVWFVVDNYPIISLCILWSTGIVKKNHINVRFIVLCWLCVIRFSWMISDVKMENSVHCLGDCVSLQHQGLTESVSEVLDNKPVLQHLITRQDFFA